MKTLFKALLILWIAMWVGNITRELIFKDRLNEYKTLLSLSLEEKRAYLTGKDLYDFLVFAKKNLPLKADYKLIGLDDGAIQRRASIYYLYPHLEKEGADFLLIYNEALPKERGYEKFAELDSKRYIMVRQ